MSQSSPRSAQQRQRRHQQQEWFQPSNTSQPPPAADLSYVPSWERRFCTSICRIPWRRFCECKKMIGSYVHRNVMQWDDSAAKEAFDNAKARFWAEINGFCCDISLPDPNLFIDKIDYDADIDPELAADLEKEVPSFMIDCKDEIRASNSTGTPIKASGRDSGEAPKGEPANNWDVQVVRRVIPTGWDDLDDRTLTGKDNSPSAWINGSWELNDSNSNIWKGSADWGAGNWQV